VSAAHRSLAFHGGGLRRLRASGSLGEPFPERLGVDNMAPSPDPTLPNSTSTTVGSGAVKLSSTPLSTAAPPGGKPGTDRAEDLTPLPRAGWGMMVLSVVLSVAAGAGGAWAYERFANKPDASIPAKAQPTAESAPSTSASAIGSDQLKDLRDGLESTRDRLKQVEDLVAALPKEPPSDVLRGSSMDRRLGSMHLRRGRRKRKSKSRSSSRRSS
jgi:hypothetical protein